MQMFNLFVIAANEVTEYEGRTFQHFNISYTAEVTNNFILCALFLKASGCRKLVISCSNQSVFAFYLHAVWKH